MSNETINTYKPSSRNGNPVRYENLWPGSYFGIYAEPSRGIRRSTDTRIYYRSKEGFFSVHPVTGLGIVLMPNDLVVPMKLVPYGSSK